MKRKPRSAKTTVRKGKVRKVIETPELLAILEIPVLFYSDDPQEPYLEPATIKLLAQARRSAKAGDKAWLKKHGAKLYVSSPAA
jgi:hypothetical protein